MQHDLDNFARIVEQSPAGALDPNSSNYLFHGDSTAAKGTTTDRQDTTMNNNPTIMPGSGNADNYEAGTGTGYTSGDSGNINPAAPGTSTTDTGLGRGTTDNPNDRPVLDRDIINEPPNTASPGSRQPGTPGDQGDVLPDERGTRNPVMPPE